MARKAKEILAEATEVLYNHLQALRQLQSTSIADGEELKIPSGLLSLQQAEHVRKCVKDHFLIDNEEREDPKAEGEDIKKTDEFTLTAYLESLKKEKRAGGSTRKRDREMRA